MARKSRRIPQSEAAAVNAVMFAAWGYTRVSSKGERTDDSIENQASIIEAFVRDKADIDLRGIIKDPGFTGTNFDRPGFAELMDKIKRGEVQCVIVKDLSRVGRTYIEVGELLFDTLPAYNVRFISVNDRYDSFADNAVRKKLFILFKNLINHMYSRDLGKKIKSSFELKQKKGELLGCLPPYGYMFTTEGGGKRLKIEPESAATVKLIFDMRARGDSMVQITDYLNRNGILPPRNHYHHLGVLKKERDGKKTRWQNGYIGALLRNEIYTGNQIQAKYERHGKQAAVRPREEWIVYEGAHPAIVDREQFDTVQRLLNEAGEKFKKLGNKLGENIFVGKIFCSRCGKALKRLYYRKNKNEIKYQYTCRDCASELRYTAGIEKAPRISLEEVDTVISAIIRKQMDACIKINELLDRAANAAVIISKRNGFNTELIRYQREIKNADDMLASSYAHHLAGLLDSREFDLARSKFEHDKQAAEAGMERIKRESADFDLLDEKRSEFLAHFRRFNGFAALDKAIVGLLIKKITVEPLTKEISVELNFTDDFEKLNKIVDESGDVTGVC